MSDLEGLVSFLRKNDLLTSDIEHAIEAMEIKNVDLPTFRRLVIRELEPYVAGHPHNAEGHARLGNAYYDMGLVDQAIMQYELSLKIEPNNYSIRHDLSVALREKGLRDGGC